MRIRLSQLRQIISEEVRKTLHEAAGEISEDDLLDTLDAAAEPYGFTFPKDLFDDERAQSFKITGLFDAPVEPEDFQNFINSLPEPEAGQGRHMSGRTFAKTWEEGPFTANSVLHHMKTSFKGVESLIKQRLPDIEVSCPGFVSGLDSHQRSQYE